MLGRYSIWPAGDVADGPVPGAAEVVAARTVYDELDCARGGGRPSRARGSTRSRARCGGVTAHWWYHTRCSPGALRQYRRWNHGYSAAGATCGAPAGCVPRSLRRRTAREPVDWTHTVPELCGGPG